MTDCTRELSVADDVPLREVRLARLSCGCRICMDELSVSQAVTDETEQVRLEDSRDR
jgi:hypothetical protein